MQAVNNYFIGTIWGSATILALSWGALNDDPSESEGSAYFPELVCIFKVMGICMWTYPENRIATAYVHGDPFRRVNRQRNNYLMIVQTHIYMSPKVTISPLAVKINSMP
jgi:hypothetical protein